MSAVVRGGDLLEVPCDGDRLLAGLAPIADRRLFCLYRLGADVERPDKLRKVPYLSNGSRLTGSFSDPRLPSSLVTLREALRLRGVRGRHFGIGVVFFPGCGVMAVDFDHVIEPDGKFKFTADQEAALRAVMPSAFLERSVSGAGLHAVCLGDAVTLKVNGVLEVFANSNFVALTGTGGRGTASLLPAKALDVVVAAVQSVRASKSNALAPPVQLQDRTSARSRLAVNADVLDTSGGNEDPAVVESALFSVSADCDYEAWMQLCFAVIWGLGAAAGFELLDRWSQTAPHRYSAEALRTLCNS